MNKILILTVGLAVILAAPRLAQAPKSVPLGDTFVRGIFGVNKKDLPQVAEAGFNVVQSYSFQRMTLEEIELYLSEAESLGLRVLLSIPGSYSINDNEKSDKKIVRLVTRFADHPALYGWYLFDEPNEKKLTPERLKRVYKMIKTLDDNHMIFVSNWEPREYRNGYDVDMRQVYHGRASLMRKVFNGGYAELMKLIDKPWVCIVNTHDSMFADDEVEGMTLTSPTWFYHGGYKYKKTDTEEYAYRLERAKLLNRNLEDPFSGVTDSRGLGFANSGSFPESPEVILGQVLSGLCHGSNAIFFWIWSNGASVDLKEGYYTTFHYHKTKDAYRTINSMLERIEPVLNEVTEDRQGQIGRLAFRYIENERGQVLMMVNESKRPFEGVIEDLEVKSPQFLDLYSNQMLDISNTQLTIAPDEGILLMNLEGP